MAILTNPLLTLLPLLLTATWIDIRRQRIPNPLSFGAAVLGLALQSLNGGWLGFTNGLGGLFIGLSLLLPFYLMRGMGAGDVKLMAAAGSFLGPQLTLFAVVGTLIAGGVMGVGVWVVRSGLSGFLTRYLRVAKQFLSAGQLPPIGAGPARSRFPYAAAIATGTLWALMQHGQWHEWLKPFAVIGRLGLA